MDAIYLTGDVGATNGRITAFADPHDPDSFLGAENFKLSKHTEDCPGDFVGQDLPNLVGAAEHLQNRFGEAAAFAGAFAGKVNPSPTVEGRTHLVDSGNLRHWIGRPLKELLATHLRCRVVLGNDAEALALADAVYGLGLRDGYRRRDFMGMIWGSGVGGACVRYNADGSFLTIAAEPGHQVLDPSSKLVCGCGKRGHLEAFCGGDNIKKYHGTSAENLDTETLTGIAERMAQGLWNILAIQPADLVIFSGGIAVGQPQLLEYIEELLDDPMVGSPQVRESAFGESAGAKGALSLLSL